MPIIQSTYRAPWWLKNKHLSTIFPTLCRKVENVNYVRKRYITSDNDFFDVDFSRKNSTKLVVILHGLEGNSKSKYAEGLAFALNEFDYDVAVLNHRGCSGEPNLLLQSYHSGHTVDLDFFVSEIQNEYDELYIVGFSLGGNITLKFLGEKGELINSKIKKAIAISVPCDLMGSSYELKKKSNKIYMNRFLKTLKSKTLQKLNKHPNSSISKNVIIKSKNFFDFDGVFTGPVHGFKDHFDYWKKSSSKQFIPKISIPTLLISAQNDPFLSESCFPKEEAKIKSNFFLEIPKFGGHVGFASGGNKYWIEKRVIDFFDEKN